MAIAESTKPQNQPNAGVDLPPISSQGALPPIHVANPGGQMPAELDPDFLEAPDAEPPQAQLDLSLDKKAEDKSSGNTGEKEE
jgi:hypothetical protein